MKRIQALLFSLFVVVASVAQPLINSYRFAGATVSPSTLTSGHVYTGSLDMWVYTAPGYPDNSDNYPLIIFYGGDGTVGTDINKFKISGEGVIDYINQGDKPPGVLICAPQIASGDYSVADQFTTVVNYMTANYRVNTNRIYVTGLSRGGFMCRLLMVSNCSDIAAALEFSGTTSSIDWAACTDVGIWFHHGTTDGTVTNSLETAMTSANVSTLDMNINALTTMYFGVGHSGTVWNTNGYNRKYRTDATGTANYDYVKWLCKFSKDQNERAQLHVNYAVSENTIEDYRLALIQVNALSAGALKTSLLSTLATLKSTIDNGGKRYLIDHGPSGQTTSGNVNNMTTHTAGASITNLIDDAGGSSTIGFQIVNQLASTAREGNLTNDRVRGQYFGLDRQTYRDGMRLNTTITNGQCKYTGLNNAKTYNVRFYVARSNNITNNPEISITIGASTKTQYCELNTTRYVEFTNVSPSSNEIVISAQNSGDTDTYILAMELFQNP